MPLAVKEKEPFEMWPDENNVDLPDRVEVTLTFFPDDSFRAVLDIPASYGVENEE
jgi:hypothetical protein